MRAPRLVVCRGAFAGAHGGMKRCCGRNTSGTGTGSLLTGKENATKRSFRMSSRRGGRAAESAGTPLVSVREWGSTDNGNS